MTTQRQTRLVFALACAAVVAVIGFLWWNCAVNPRINFLLRHQGAEWIVYPFPPGATSYPTNSFSAQFRKVFTLNSISNAAKLSVRAFKHCEVRINGQTISLPENENWKQARSVDVSSNLREGENEIMVTVSHSEAPPALWLTLNGEKQIFGTDEKWEASLADAEWHAAGLADAPRKLGVGNYIFTSETVFKSLSQTWLLLALFAVISVLFVSICRKAPLKLIEERPSLALLVLLSVVWLVLFAHNLPLLPSMIGFDVEQHLKYVKYVVEREALPLANDGFEMFQPPLYYVVCALALKISGLGINQAGVELLRWMGFLVGVAHLIFVWLSLRLLFTETRKQIIGAVFAAFLPMHLYMAHYISNESLAAMLVSASVYFCLRILRAENFSMRNSAWLGIFLGLAMLAKLTALLVFPAIFISLAWKLFSKRERGAPVWFKQIVLPLLIALVVCGWHYARVWARFGTPLIGNWDAQVGFTWWQEDGYRTAAWFTRFGSSLVNPLYSSFQSFWDGIYSTFWSDSMCGGASQMAYRPPWNYTLVFTGCLLALLPTAAILLGVARATKRFFRELDAERFLLLGFSATVWAAVIFMCLKVPSYGQVKSFYALSTLVPLAAFSALGFDLAMKRVRILSIVLTVLVGVWALNSYASHWILPHSAAPEIAAGLRMAADGQFDMALKKFAHAHELEPDNLDARCFLAKLLNQLGRREEARLLVEEKTALEDSNCRLIRAGIFADEGQLEPAIAHARRAIELGPENGQVYRYLSTWLVQSGRIDEAVTVARKGLGVAPLNNEMQAALAAAIEKQK